MTGVLDRHHAQWVTAAPLWDGIVGTTGTPDADAVRDMQRPALLSFSSDEFMDELAQLLDTDPASLEQHLARGESHRERVPGEPRGGRIELEYVKLYQPIHGDFNLVAATLVCRVQGMPDKAVETAAGEKVGFVLRRLSGDTELGWAAAGNGEHEWLELEQSDALAEREEVLPMFPLAFTPGERRRRLFVGLIPTASHESSRKGLAAASLRMQPAERITTPTDPRMDELEARVIGPVQAMKDAAGQPVDEQQREASRFVLLDLAELLQAELPDVWAKVESPGEPSGQADRAVHRLLDDAYAEYPTTWRQALAQAWDENPLIAGDAAGTPATNVNLRLTDLDLGAFHDAFEQALPTAAGGEPDTAEQPFDAPKLDPRTRVRYRLRCVYERPNCGPLHPPLVSRPSREFAIASFFDFDAPARPLTIALPVDTSIRDLRKFRKSVSFLISDQLKQQMSRVADAKEALKGNVESGDPLDIGVICSFSIPIITICALMVLMIILSLLNIVFWWLPFFRICFPIPLKSGSSS